METTLDTQNIAEIVLTMAKTNSIGRRICANVERKHSDSKTYQLSSDSNNPNNGTNNNKIEETSGLNRGQKVSWLIINAVNGKEKGLWDEVIKARIASAAQLIADVESFRFAGVLQVRLRKSLASKVVSGSGKHKGAISIFKM